MPDSLSIADLDYLESVIIATRNYIVKHQLSITLTGEARMVRLLMAEKAMTGYSLEQKLQREFGITVKST